jgi:acyl-CoA reductase-like NAD-dependent aldehyde dehydrogenase
MPVDLKDVLIAQNPATAASIGTFPATSASEVEAIVARARAAQEDWSRVRLADRLRPVRRWWEILSRDSENWADWIRLEIGKPRIEAMAGDVVPTLDALRWTVKHASRVLADQRNGAGWQRTLLLPAARISWVPFGVIGILGTWNYPLFLNVPNLAMALAAGNAVVWKPSELATFTGQKIEASLAEAGFPPDLVATLYGGGEVGQALTGSPIDKGLFTGGVENGRRVLTSLAERGRPAIAELSGFDPAIILPDAPFKATIRALTWAAFVGCGQTCVSVKRLIVVGDPGPWAEAIAAAAQSLRVGNPASDEVDLGPLISESARARFDQKIRACEQAGARALAGAQFREGPGWFYEPTVLLAAENAERAEAALAGAFGPVVLVRGVADIEKAVSAANGTEFALGASVWGRDPRTTREVATRLLAGSVSINEAVTPTAHASAPFGGMKASGHGRTHGAMGLREFVQPRTLFRRRFGGFRPQLFPYGTSKTVPMFLKFYQTLFHPWP